MSTILWFVALIVWVTLFAKLEVEIEGQHGWAEKAPSERYRWDTREQMLFFHPFGEEYWIKVDHLTWPGSFYKFYITKVLGGRDYTNYHRTVDAIQVFVAHAVTWGIFYGTAHWGWIELRAFGFFLMIPALEDTLYFGLNPFYGFGKYLKKEIPWHNDWLWILPKMIWMNLAGALFLIAISFIMPIIF